MDYRAHIKQLMMNGQMYKGQGISKVGIPHMQINDYRGTGTISHRAVVGLMDPLIQRMNDLNIKGHKARKKVYDVLKPITRTEKGSENFKSLKFNF